MNNKLFPGFLLIMFFLVYISETRGQTDKFKALEKQLDSLRIRFNIPAIAYGVVRNDSIIVRNVIGYRNIETGEKAQVGDLFHIGSNTKSFTAFLSGKIVETGLIRWNTRFFDLFPEMKEGSNAAYNEITLEQLLCHKARLIPFKDDSEVCPIADYEKNLKENLSLKEKRYYFIKQVLKYEPIPIFEHAGDRYSNAGYIAAALMLEKATGKSWEQLILEISDDLKLHIHIGWPDSDDPHQPQGHINPAKWRLDMDKDLIPLPSALKKYHYFNQYSLLCSPSGNLSITTDGFLEFLRLHIEGLNGKDNYLKSETYRRLMASYPEYSFGWWNETFNSRFDYSHRGSMGTFYSFVCIVPKINTGIVVMINSWDENGLSEIVKVLVPAFE